MKRIAVGMAICLLISVLAGASVWAQATAQISGTVRDQTGAVLPGVEVTATQIDTGIARTTVTNETGSYVLSNLALGPYRLEAGLPGFRTFAQTGIVLQINSSPVVNPVLQVGQVSEQVEVQANAALVETRNSGIGQVVENERILELPLNGRNVQDLVTLSGAAVNLGTTSGRNFAGSPRLQVAGGTAYGVDYMLDGANHINQMGSGSQPMPFPDALQEFKVETSGTSGSTGMAAAISGVTKSGTNQFHGDLFEFVRNDLFNARQYFSAKGSTLKRNQFGGTAGGPILKNKLFFFGGYQKTTIRQDPADNQTFLPTPAMLAGDWTTFTSPACNAGRAIALRAPFVNNRIDPAQYSKAGSNLMNRIIASSPQKPNDCGLVIFGRRAIENDFEAIGRLDYQWTANHSLFGRYYASEIFQPTPFSLSNGNLLTSSVEGNDNFAQSFTVGSTYLLGPNVVNSFRFSASRIIEHQLSATMFSACDLGVRMYCGYATTRTQIAITSGPSIGTSHADRDELWNNNFTINDDVSLVRGAHQLAFGANPYLMYAGVFDNFFDVGRWIFTGATTGHGLGDVLTGRAGLGTFGTPFHEPIREWFFASYASDTWKAKPKLTLSYGVRWDPYFPQVMPRGQAANFDYKRFQQGIKSTVFPTSPAGWSYAGDPGFPGMSGSNKNWMNFAPHLGMAWDVNGDGRLAVRASYSLGFAKIGGHLKDEIGQIPPFAYQLTQVNPVGGFDDPFLGYPGGNPFPAPTDNKSRLFPQFPGLVTVPYNTKSTYTSTWNLSIQKQLGQNFLVSGAYIGSQTAHLWVQDELNPATFFPGGPCTINGVTYNPCSSATNTNQRRRFYMERPADGQFMANVAELAPNGVMGYHGMLLTAQRRATKGVTVNANYTWSHCIGDQASLTTGPRLGDEHTMPGARWFDRGDCDGDRRQIFNLTSVAQTPQFSNPTIRMIASNWTFSGIYRRSSGQPLNVVVSGDRALNGVIANLSQPQRGSQIGPNPYGDGAGGPLTNWLNPASFAMPDLGSLGNYRRNSVVGPPQWSFDVALSRAFRLRETQRLEFRAEAFNLTNSFRPGNPNASLTSAQFGQLRTSSDPRLLQFALKYVF